MGLSTDLEVRDHLTAVQSDVTVYGASPAQPRMFSAVIVGSAGNVTIRSPKGNLATFACIAGQRLDVVGTQLMNTGTTATGLVLLFGTP